MEIEKGLQIAKREWGNIRVSLEKFGNIGEFDITNIANTFISGGPLLITNLVAMDEKLPRSGYITKEASYAYTFLAERAAKNLGLSGELAQTFGSGYSWVRTSWFNPIELSKESVVQQLFFFKLFFPRGSLFSWDFNSEAVKTKFSTVLSRFTKWQDYPSSYFEDVITYGGQLDPLWRSLSVALEIGKVDNGRKYQAVDDVELRI